MAVKQEVTCGDKAVGGTGRGKETQRDSTEQLVKVVGTSLGVRRKESLCQTWEQLHGLLPAPDFLTWGVGFLWGMGH